MKKEISKLVIALDGPAGAGKSTVARLVAERFGLTYIDTGAMYRAVTWLALRHKLSMPNQQAELMRLLIDAEIKLLPAEKRSDSNETFQKVFLNEQEITEQIRTPEITQLVSIISAIPEVREHLVKLQQRMGAAGGVILDGRDIGSTVFPKADLKVFLVASSQERALRRQKQLMSLNIDCKLQDIQNDIEKRDYLDYSRKVSPLRQAKDAILIDTDNLLIDEVVNRISHLIEDLISS